MKYVIVIILVIVFLAALINFMKLAHNKKATTRQLLVMALDVAYLPASLVIVLWLLGII